MKTASLLAALPFAAAYPWAMEASENMMVAKRQNIPMREPNFLSGRTNLGGFTGPPAPFNAQAQLVDVRPGGPNEFRSPGRNDRRGQCPGLNAAANHGFLPRNGLPNILQTVDGLGRAYSMAPDLSLFLAVFSVAISGDYITQRWSIGGTFPVGGGNIPIIGGVIGGLLGAPTGILGTHNRYEGDASIVRGDAFLNNGLVNIFQMRSWEHLFSLIGDSLSIDDAARQNEFVSSFSLHNNPQYFSAPFAGLVTPAAHNFVINFMSNHSAENNGGFLTADVLKQFFSVTGDAPGSFVHTPGQERIPQNWYKRSQLNAYTIASTVLDVQVSNLMYPGIVRFGGNTGEVDSFVGVNLEDISDTFSNGATLAEGGNLGCFLLQASQATIIDSAGPLVRNVGALLNFVTDQLGPIRDTLNCPALGTFRSDLFDRFPGAPPRNRGGLADGILG